MEQYTQRKELSYRNLLSARERARKKNNYKYEEAREDMLEWVDQKFHNQPHDWQLDAAEAIFLGLDTILISPTGSGKSLPFIIPLAKHTPSKKIIIISPLIALQHDMAQKFNKMGVSSVAVNSDTKSNKLFKKILQDEFQIILTSPEMCLLDTSFRPLLNNETFAASIIAFVIDEAHCISQWSGDFRPSYGYLDQLRSFVPMGIPILATSATLNPKALAEVTLSLKINLNKAFFLNRGNDRPNITPSIVIIKSGTDFNSLNSFFLSDNGSINSKKTMIFTNNRMVTQEICRHLQSLFPEDIHNSITYFHALRSAQAKRIVLEKFRRSEVKILVSTEAAGMGADMSDIKRVLQLGVPPSLTTWIQRAGRAGRDPNIQAEAILMVEQSVFQTRKKRRSEKVSAPSSVPQDSVTFAHDTTETLADGDRQADNSNREALDTTDYVYAKKVEGPLRAYVEAKESCYRDETDAHYDYPPILRQPPTGDCCGNCPEGQHEHHRNENAQAPTDHLHAPLEQTQPATARARTPPPVEGVETTPDSPEKTRNENGKRVMGPQTAASTVEVWYRVTRKSFHREAAVSKLKDWRRQTKLTVYADMPFTAPVLLPDAILQKIATDGTLQTVSDMNEKLNPKWVFAEEHGIEILGILKALDEQQRKIDDELTEHKRILKKARTEASRAQDQTLQLARREEQRKQQEAARHEQQFQRMVANTTPGVSTGILASSSVLNLSVPPPNFYPLPDTYTHPSFSYDPPTASSQAQFSLHDTFYDHSLASQGIVDQNLIPPITSGQSTATPSALPAYRVFDPASTSFNKEAQTAVTTRGGKASVRGRGSSKAPARGRGNSITRGGRKKTKS